MANESLVWQHRTVTRKSSVRKLFHISVVGHDILKFEQILLFYSASYFNLGVLGALFRRS